MELPDPSQALEPKELSVQVIIASLLTLGNGVRRRLIYDPNRQWLKSQRDTRRGTSIFDVRYDYLPNGKLSGTQSTSNSWNLVVTSDTVGRLRSITGSRAQSWSYDNAGNMNFNSALGYYTYPAPGPQGCLVAGQPAPCKQPHAAQSAGPLRLLRYDDNGLLSMATSAANQTRSIDWTYDHLPALVVDFDGTRTDYEYDAFGDLAVETKPNETVFYFGNFTRTSSLYGVTNLIPIDGKPFAEKGPFGPRWYHLDRSGALRAVSDQTGKAASHTNYGPYGEPLPVGAPTPRGAYRHSDSEMFGGTQLQLLGARLYDPVIGRFLGPDSIVPDPLNPQALNRYAFGYNAPLDYIDPSGLQPADIGITGYGGGAPISYGSGSGFTHQLYVQPPTILPPRSATFVPLPVQPRGPASTQTGGGTGVGPRLSILRINWSDPAEFEKYLALREYAHVNAVCGHCHVYTPDLSLRLLTDEETKAQRAAFAGVSGVAMAAALLPVVVETAAAVGGSEAIVTGSIWLYARAPIVWNGLLAIGYGLAGVAVSPYPRLTPGSPKEMLGQLLGAIRNIPPPSRVAAIRNMLGQIARANDGWKFEGGAFEAGGHLFVGTLPPPTPALWILPNGQVLYGRGAFQIVEGVLRFVWTNAPQIVP